MAEGMAAGRTLVYAAVAAAVALSLLLLVVQLQQGEGGGGGGHGSGEGGGLLVVVSFPNLASDVEQLLCPGDRVESIAPAGVDPHDYQLSPRDVELVKRASIVVSTGHAPFEVKLAELVPGDRLIVIPRIPGVRIAANPVTGKPNYHMPIYDPSNYKAFIRYLAERLEEARPECRSHYLEAASRVAGRVDRIVASAPRLDRVAVASTPAAVYAVEWLGLNVSWLLVPEHGVPPTQETISRAEKLLSQGAVAVVLVNSKGEPWGKPDSKLVEAARSMGAPVVGVPAPFTEGSIPEKLEAIVANVSRLAQAG